LDEARNIGSGSNTVCLAVWSALAVVAIRGRRNVPNPSEVEGFGSVVGQYIGERKWFRFGDAIWNVVRGLNFDSEPSSAPDEDVTRESLPDSESTDLYDLYDSEVMDLDY